MVKRSQMIEPKDECWLYQELRAATERQERHLALYECVRDEYTTQGWDAESKDDALSQEYDPENMAYVYVTGQVGEMLAGTPRVRVESRHARVSPEMQMELLGGEFAMNEWLADSEFRRSREMLAYDLLFAGAMGYVSETVNPYTYRSSDAPEGWPSIERVSPEDQLKDPLAKSREEVRFLGHHWWIPKKDLVELAKERTEDGWDIEQVKGLAGVDREDGDYPDREMVRVADLWFPGYELKSGNPWGAEPTGGPKRGQHGTVFTLAVDDVRAKKTHGREGVALLRTPRAWYGYREGPYVLGDVNLVPDSAFGLAPLIATYGQRMDLNRIAKAISKAIREYKRLTGVDVDLAPQLEEKIKSGEFDSIIPLSGAGGKPLRDLVGMIEAGGLPQDGLVYIQIALERWFRNQGLGEAQTGRADGDATATAVAVATTESQRRSARTLNEWAQMNQAIIDRVGFFVLTSKSVKVQLSVDAIPALAVKPEDAQANKVYFQGGGLTPEQFEAAAIELEAESLTPPTPEMRTQRALMGHEILMGGLQAMTMVPVPQTWVPYYDKLGREMGLSSMKEQAELLIGGVTLAIQQNPQMLAPAQQTPHVEVKAGGSTGQPSMGQGRTMQNGRAGPGLPSSDALVKKAGGGSVSPAGNGRAM